MYEIIIKETKTVTKSVGREWKQVGERAATLEDIDNHYGSQEKYEGKMVAIYDYTPMIDKEVEKEDEIYRQKIESLDLKGVIAAVNSMAGGL